MAKSTKFQEALDLIASLAGHVEPINESHYELLKEAEKFLSKHDPTMNIDKAVRLLDKARNDQDSTLFLRITIVDHVGTWAAGQKSSPRISKLLSDCHHLHQRFSSLPEKNHSAVDSK